MKGLTQRIFIMEKEKVGSRNGRDSKAILNIMITKDLDQCQDSGGQNLVTITEEHHREHHREDSIEVARSEETRIT